MHGKSSLSEAQLNVREIGRCGWKSPLEFDWRGLIRKVELLWCHGGAMSKNLEPEVPVLSLPLTQCIFLGI